jgi:hypothetical protein
MSRTYEGAKPVLVDRTGKDAVVQALSAQRVT